MSKMPRLGAMPTGKWLTAKGATSKSPGHRVSNTKKGVLVRGGGCLQEPSEVGSGRRRCAAESGDQREPH